MSEGGRTALISPVDGFRRFLRRVRGFHHYARAGSVSVTR
ncbi:hypothetical protein HMPREF9440_02280 [Sutterella parvirubra YIT 11816]|uniref:Uncharacterized protein n=1 Tax=Sutterella parvirubra YIT 11816 TaxID=762967 RepID=H3KHN4_9BURK|nr:hypothetical protein HMPREF9440_02280 [Sutterella parvirubra YIT 11816]